jgi:hypothetical protein
MENIYVAVCAYILGISLISMIFILGFVLIGGFGTWKTAVQYFNAVLAKRPLRINIISVFASVYLVLWFLMFLVFMCFLFHIGSVATYDVDGLWLFNKAYLIPRMINGYNTGNTFFGVIFFGILGVKASIKVIEMRPLLKEKELTLRGFGPFQIIE